MLLGAMNHPDENVIQEIEWIAAMGFQFVDLTIEPPKAFPDKFDTQHLKRTLQDLQLGIVGHTAFYLPIAHPFKSVRFAAIEELKKCIKIFAELGASWMNLHPDRHAPLH